MRYLVLLLALAACGPTLNTGAEVEIRLYVAPNGDVILEAPRPIDFGNVRLAATSIDSLYLLSPEPSIYGYRTLVYPDKDVNYGVCLRIRAEKATAGWVGVTMINGDYSEAQELDTRKRRPPQGCGQ